MQLKLTGSLATILASLIGGVCALAAAIVPMLLPAKTEPSTVESTVAITGLPAPAQSPPATSPPTTHASPDPAATRPNFGYGTWTITASKDDEGNTWNNSTIKFTSEQATADGVEFAGFFEWRMNDRLLGREFFSGRYVAADRMMYFEGQSVQSPTNELAVGSFSCRLSDDNRKLLDGTWGNTVGNLSGVLGLWTARR